MDGPAGSFTISLAASQTVLAPGDSTTLRATVNQDVGPTPFYIEIFDWTTLDFLADCGAGTSCSTTVVGDVSKPVQDYITFVCRYSTAFADAVSLVIVTLLGLLIHREVETFARTMPTHFPSGGGDDCYTRRMSMATTSDPVCGMTIEESAAASSTVHKGSTYCFCSPACRERFDADPDRYGASAPDSRSPA